MRVSGYGWFYARLFGMNGLSFFFFFFILHAHIFKSQSSPRHPRLVWVHLPSFFHRCSFIPCIRLCVEQFWTLLCQLLPFLPGTHGQYSRHPHRESKGIIRIRPWTMQPCKMLHHQHCKHRRTKVARNTEQTPSGIPSLRLPGNPKGDLLNIIQETEEVTVRTERDDGRL